VKRAFITGITGQDGSYLAEWLLEKGYEVHGLVHRPESLNAPYLSVLREEQHRDGSRVRFHQGDIEDASSLQSALASAQPHEVYHLAAQSHVGQSFEAAELTCRVTALGSLKLLQLAQQLPEPPKVFQAASSEVFGAPEQSPQDESTPFAPVTPYGCAKAFAAQIGGVYRRSFGLFVVNGILFNHESPRRGEQFVTRKICRAAAAVKLGLQKEVVMGNISSQRDWGHARDYVRGMWLSLQQANAEDFVFATGTLHSVKNVLEIAFGELQLNWESYTRYDPQLSRRSDPQRLVGNPAKAKRILDWKPETSFREIIVEMTRAELSALQAKPS
jgi:GDPmannose 4,6-dehydratase